MFNNEQYSNSGVKVNRCHTHISCDLNKYSNLSKILFANIKV